jgi:hypothetical protein
VREPLSLPLPSHQSNYNTTTASTAPKQEKDRAAHIQTTIHKRWVESASAFALAAFAPLLSEPTTQPEEEGGGDGGARSSAHSPTQPPASLPPPPPPPPVQTPLLRRKPIDPHHVTPATPTPGPTPQTMPLRPSMPTHEGRAVAAGAGSPVVPRKEQFAEE